MPSSLHVESRIIKPLAARKHCFALFSAYSFRFAQAVHIWERHNHSPSMPVTVPCSRPQYSTATCLMHPIIEKKLHNEISRLDLGTDSRTRIFYHFTKLPLELLLKIGVSLPLYLAQIPCTKTVRYRYQDAAENVEFLKVRAHVKHLSTSLYHLVCDFGTPQL
jgi:hypothetical protein